MSKTRENPYSIRRSGSYKDLFDCWRKNRSLSRQAMVAYCLSKLGMSIDSTNADVTVIVSPRLTSTRGDCRGNKSSAGHLYYAEKMPRKWRAGVREPQKFRLRWRKHELPPRKRNDEFVIKSEKDVLAWEVHEAKVEKAKVRVK